MNRPDQSIHSLPERVTAEPLVLILRYPDPCRPCEHYGACTICRRARATTYGQYEWLCRNPAWR